MLIDSVQFYRTFETPRFFVSWSATTNDVNLKFEIIEIGNPQWITESFQYRENQCCLFTNFKSLVVANISIAMVS